MSSSNQQELIAKPANVKGTAQAVKLSSTAPAAYDYGTYWRGLHDRHRGMLRAVGYPALGEGFNRVTYRMRLGAARRLLVRWHLRCTSVLEGAVGVGAYAGLWPALGATHWEGFDMSPTTVEYLRARYPGSAFHVADITAPELAALGMRRDTYDLVTAIDVLYHLVNDDDFTRALRNVGARVAGGGHLLLSDVFSDPARQIAPHVKRRPIFQYERALSELGFSLVGREPVFAILGDPVTRPGRPLCDRALFSIWRVISKSLRLTPEAVRAPLGWAMAVGVLPLDFALRAAGFAQGVNLELALFQRTAGRRT
jgi:SAM-dependent methyltransferase